MLNYYSGNDDYVVDGVFKFEEYLNADDDRLPSIRFDSPSDLVSLLNLRNVDGHIEGASFESCRSALQRLDLGPGSSTCPLLEPRRAVPQSRNIGAFQRVAPRDIPRRSNENAFLRDAVPILRGLGSGASLPPQRDASKEHSKGSFQGNAIPVAQGSGLGNFPRNFVFELKRGHVLSPPRTPLQRLPPRLLSPFVSPQTKHQQPNWQANNHMEPMYRVITSPSPTMPSTSESRTILPDNIYSHGRTIPAGFDQRLENPRGHTIASETSLASVFDDMPDNIKWSEEASQFFAQHRTGWEMTPEERSEASAFYDFYYNSEPIGSSRMLKRIRSDDGDSTRRPTKILRTEVREETSQELNPRENHHSSGTSGRVHSTNLAPINVPYVSNAHTMGLGLQRLQRGTESVKFAPGPGQYPPLNNGSPADQLPVRNMQSRISLQNHLKTRRKVTEEDSKMVKSRYGNFEL